mmetsp:Transcript_35279/g.99882  ORF Transcript_35279/g.99882 Transcript_35279/m.99882 type:complete len:224 (+) Transcript_35279:236-907(+)
MFFLRLLFSGGAHRGSLSSVSGHRGRRSTHSPSAGSSEAGGGSLSPSSTSLSIPAHATITPLSVHRRGGGHTSSSPASSAIRKSAPRTSSFRATPPATTKDFICGNDSLAHWAPRAVRSERCLTATLWNEAAMSARVCLLLSEGSPTSFSMASLTLVLSPAYEKSQFWRFFSGTGNLKASGSPSLAIASRAAPPWGLASSPSSRATLSKASPIASSSVDPSCR